MLKQAFGLIVWQYQMFKSLFNGLDSCQGPYTTQRAQPEANKLECTIKYDAWFCCVIDAFYTQHYIKKVQLQIIQMEADINL